MWFWHLVCSLVVHADRWSCFSLCLVPRILDQHIVENMKDSEPEPHLSVNSESSTVLPATSPK